MIFYQKYPDNALSISKQKNFLIKGIIKSFENKNNLDNNYKDPQEIQKIICDNNNMNNIINENKELEESNQIDKVYHQHNKQNNEIINKEKEINVKIENKDKQIPNNIGYNINNQLKSKVYLGQNLNSEEVCNVKIIGDGNCFYRCLSFFLLNIQNFYEDIKNCIIGWIKNNYKTFVNFFGDDVTNNIPKETLAKLEFDYIQNCDSWGSHYTISIACLLFNLDIALYIKDDDDNYKRYILFSQNDGNNHELCILEFENNNHFNIIYSKQEEKENIKNSNFASSIKDIKINTKFNFKNLNIEGEKLNSNYVECKLQSSKVLYDEIAMFLFSIKENKSEIDKMVIQNPNWNYNYILSKYNIFYPKRLQGKDSKLNDKRQAFRKYQNTYKLDNNNRLCVLNPLNKDKDKEKYYKNSA